MTKTITITVTEHGIEYQSNDLTQEQLEAFQCSIDEEMKSELMDLVENSNDQED